MVKWHTEMRLNYIYNTEWKKKHSDIMNIQEGESHL